MLNRFYRSGACVGLSLLAACLGDPEPPESPQPQLGTQSAAIIYGEDDRREVYEHPDAMWRERAKSSSIALIQARNLQRPSSGRVSVSKLSLGELFDLCPGERFAEQPAAADCSAVLIDRDLVLTAGHCFEASEGCDSYAYVFDYFYASEGQLETLSAADVYGCRDFVIRRLSPQHSSQQMDFAIVQLDRPALAPRQPALISNRRLTKGDPVISLGYTSGLPAKIDSGAQVIDPRSAAMDYFRLNSDTFAGSSGAGVFDREGALVGVLVRGGKDYVTSDAGCSVAERVPAEKDGSPWEQATYATRAIEALCATGWPSVALCGVEPSCGDGFCTMDEVAGSCPVDCASAACSRPPCTKAGQPLLVAGSPADDERDEQLTDGGADPKARRPEGCSIRRATTSEVSGFAQILLLLTAAHLCRRRARKHLSAGTS